MFKLGFHKIFFSIASDMYLNPVIFLPLILLALRLLLFVSCFLLLAINFLNKKPAIAAGVTLVCFGHRLVLCVVINIVSFQGLTDVSRCFLYALHYIRGTFKKTSNSIVLMLCQYYFIGEGGGCWSWGEYRVVLGWITGVEKYLMRGALRLVLRNLHVKQEVRFVWTK